MSIRFTQLEQQAVPFTSMRETPRAYCDDLYRMAKLAFLNMMMNLVAGNPALLSQGQNFDSGNSIAQIPAILTTSSEALQEPISIQPMQYLNQHAKVLVATVQRENESGSIGSNPTNPIAGVIKTVVQECTLLSKNTLVIKMSKIFKVAKLAIAISVLCAGVGYTGNKWSEEGYQSGASIQIENDSINKQGNLWHRDNKIVDGTYSVIDGSGTTFSNIPVGTSNKDLIKHFQSKDEYKNHKFFPDEYTTIKWDDLADGNPANKWTKDVGSDKGCVPFQYYVDNNNWSVRYDGLEKTRNDYIKACGWNDFVNMSYKVSEGTMFKFKASHYLCFAWFGLVALFACIPAAWILFFRGIGKAYRSARNEIKGDKQ